MMPQHECRIGQERFEIGSEDPAYPACLKVIDRPPKRLYLIGNPKALCEGLAVVGARKATPYGISCARHFSELAALHGIAIISGGARGCDAAAHDAALAVGGMTVAFLGGGCDKVYPKENLALFRRIVAAGGAIVSEHAWDTEPRPYMFRERNRLIAGLAKATLIVEAGLPSGTFSTADAALAASREVLVVPGSIASPHSRGANRLIYQGATPIVDDESFEDQLFGIYGCLRHQASEPDAVQTAPGVGKTQDVGGVAEDGTDVLLEAVLAQPMGIEELRTLACVHISEGDPLTVLMVWLAHAQRAGLIAQYPDGRFGPCIKAHA